MSGPMIQAGRFLEEYCLKCVGCEMEGDMVTLVVVVKFSACQRVNPSWCLIHEKLDGSITELIGHGPIIEDMKPVCVVPRHESDSEETLTVRAINNNVSAAVRVEVPKNHRRELLAMLTDCLLNAGIVMLHRPRNETWYGIIQNLTHRGRELQTDRDALDRQERRLGGLGSCAAGRRSIPRRVSQ